MASAAEGVAQFVEVEDNVEENICMPSTKH